MTPIAHAAVGLLGWKWFSRREGFRPLLVYVFIACALDLDFVFYYLFGKPDVFIHQLYTHTIFIALALAVLFAPLLKTGRERWGLAVVAVSHLVMDLFVIDTVPPTGFRMFYPLWNKFFSYGFFPYVVRDTWVEVFSVRNFVAVGCEVAVFAVPALIICRKEARSLWHALRRKSAA